MRIPFTENDYARAMRRVWPTLSQRQRALVFSLSREGRPEAFTIEQIAIHCEESPQAFVAIIGGVASSMAEHLGMSLKIENSTAWYEILIERSGDSRTLSNLRTPFANSLKKIGELPFP